MKKNKQKKFEVVHQEASTCAKWMSLYEAVNIIADKAQEKNIPFSKIEIKPLEVYKYMEATENIFLRKILRDEYQIDVCYDDFSEKNLNYEKY
jgi:ArsR family metal-binding transcriptional regulator